MSDTTPVREMNHLIGLLPRVQQNRILKWCEPVKLALGTTLHESNQPFEHVYFPFTGFISLVTTIDDYQPLESGLIGNEGMLGVTLVLGVNAAPLRAMVQGTGTALMMTTVQFQQELCDGTCLLHTLNRYLYVLMEQLSQTGACNRFHKIEPRLARCLLMIHDRTHTEYFHITHERLSNMLGVRRSSISIAAGALQRRKLISYDRGEISILDRKGLEAASCKCYDAMNNRYAKLFA